MSTFNETMASTATLSITVNGQPRRVPDATSLAHLVAEHLQADAASLATAVNGEFVPRAQRAARQLRAGDQVTCFQPIVGG